MKLGLKLGLDVSKLSGASYDASTQAIFDYASSQGYTEPSDDVKSALDTMIIALKGAGIWNKLDIIYVLATDGDRDFAKINIKNPGTFDCTEVGTPTFTSLQGFTGSSTAALNTGWNSLNDGINASINNQSLFTWVYTMPPLSTTTQSSAGSASINTSFGGTSITARSNQFDGAGNKIKSRFNNTAEVTFVNTASAGLYHVDRNNSSNFQFYLNGVQDANSGSSSNADNDNDIYICASRSSGGGVTSSCHVPISIAGSGESLVSEQADLYTAFNTYMSNL